VSPGAGEFTDVVRFTSAATGQTVSVRVHHAPAGHAAPRRTAVPIAAAAAAVLLSLAVLWLGPHMKAASTVPTASVSGYGYGGGGAGYDGGGGGGGGGAASAMRTPLTARSAASAHGTPRSPLLSSAATAPAGGGDTFHTSPMSPFQPYSAARGGGGVSGGGGVDGGGGTGTGGMRSEQPTRFSFGSPLPYPPFSTDRR